MIGIILSILDILAGLSILFNVKIIIGYLAFAMLIKGLISLLSSFATKYFFEWMGAVDFVTGIILLLISMNVYSGFFSPFGWVVILKGIYSLLRYLLHF